MFPCRSVYKRATNNLDLKCVSEEGFLFLTDRSDFWRSQKPIYVTKDEKEQNAMSKKKNVRAATAKNPARASVQQPARSKSAPSIAKRASRAKSAPAKGKRQFN